MEPGTASERLVARLRVVAEGPGFGPDAMAAALRAVLAERAEPVEPELAVRAPGVDWVLTPVHRERGWSVLVAVFAPGVAAPIHDHGSWAVIGIVRGRERETRFRRKVGGGLEVDRTLINPRGAVTVVPDGALHTVQALDGRDAVSIHVYGTDIVTQPRHTYHPVSGEASAFRPPFAAAVRR